MSTQFHPSINESYYLWNLHEFQNSSTPVSHHNYFVLDQSSNTLTTGRAAKDLTNCATDLYEISKYAQRVLDEHGCCENTSILTYNVLSLNLAIRSHNNQIDNMLWIQVLHVVLAILTVGIIQLKSMLHITELTIDLSNIIEDANSEKRLDIPASFFLFLDPTAREESLAKVEKYQTFKSQIQDFELFFSTLVGFIYNTQDNNVALADVTNKKGESIQNDSFLFKTREEIAQTQISSSIKTYDWLKVFSFPKGTFSREEAETPETLRICDLPYLNDNELTNLFTSQVLSKEKFDRFHPYSIWNLLPFDVLKDLSIENFQKIIGNYFLFSPLNREDIGRFFELDKEKQNFFLQNCQDRAVYGQALFPSENLSFDVLNKYEPASWPTILSLSEDLSGINKACEKFASLPQEDVERIISASIDAGLKLPLHLLLSKEQINQLAQSFWENEKFLTVIFEPKEPKPDDEAIRENEQKIKLLQEFVPLIPQDSLEAMLRKVDSLDEGSPLLAYVPFALYYSPEQTANLSIEFLKNVQHFRLLHYKRGEHGTIQGFSGFTREQYVAINENLHAKKIAYLFSEKSQIISDLNASTKPNKQELVRFLQGVESEEQLKKKFGKEGAPSVSDFSSPFDDKIRIVEIKIEKYASQDPVDTRLRSTSITHLLQRFPHAHLGAPDSADRRAQLLREKDDLSGSPHPHSPFKKRGSTREKVE